MTTTDCSRFGDTFTAARRARFCSDACRTAAARARRDGLPESLPAVPDSLPSVTPSPMVHAVTTLLAGVVDAGAAGAAALDLARRLDGTPDAAAAAAQLHRELRQALDKIEGTPTREPDALDLLRMRAAQKMAAARAQVGAAHT